VAPTERENPGGESPPGCLGKKGKKRAWGKKIEDHAQDSKKPEKALGCN